MLVLAVGGLVALGGMVAGPDAGATDRPYAGQADLLVPAYVPIPGQGASVHAVCHGTDAVEVGVHPFDGVARSFQVWSDDDGLLVNIVSADETLVVPLVDGPARVVYSGTSSYDLATDLCVASETVPTTALPVPPPVAPPVTEVPGPVGDPPPAGPATSIPRTGVLLSSNGPMTRDELPATGAGDWLGVAALVGAAAVVTGATIEVATRKGRRS